jgi:hypothetical protein
MLFAVLLVLECCFLPETLYPRELVVQAEMNQIQIDDTGLKRTTQLGYFVRDRRKRNSSWTVANIRHRA